MSRGRKQGSALLGTSLPYCMPKTCSRSTWGRPPASKCWWCAEASVAHTTARAAADSQEHRDSRCCKQAGPCRLRNAGAQPRQTYLSHAAADFGRHILEGTQTTDAYCSSKGIYPNGMQATGIASRLTAGAMLDDTLTACSLREKNCARSRTETLQLQNPSIAKSMKLDVSAAV